MSLANHPIVRAVRAKYPSKIIGYCVDELGLPYGFLNLSIPFADRVQNWRDGSGISNYYWASGMCLGSNDGKRVMSFDSVAKLKALWRFEGYADEIVRSIRHTGWFTDDVHQDSDMTIRGAVAQLPGRNGQPVYLAGYEDVCGGMFTFYPESFDDKDDAARRADGHAEYIAENEREYRAKEREEEQEREEEEERERAEEAEREARGGHLDYRRGIR